MGIFRKQSTWSKVTEPVRKAWAPAAVRSGVAAGASMLVLSAASAAASAIRRRAERP